MDARTVASPATAFNPPALKRLPPLVAARGQVRLVKDVLRVGSYHVGPGRTWKVTPDVLSSIAQAFQLQLKARMIPPLCYTHSGDSEPDERNSVASVAHLWLEDNCLYFGVYVSPATAAELQKMHRQVSIKCLYGFTDGTGRTWPVFIQHIAIVQHARVPNQIPFVQMGLDGGSTTAKGKRGMTFEVVMKMVNGLLKALDYNVSIPTSGPDAVTEKNFDTTVPVILRSVISLTEDEEVDATKDDGGLPVMRDPAIEMSALNRGRSSEMSDAEVQREIDKLARMR